MMKFSKIGTRSNQLCKDGFDSIVLKVLFQSRKGFNLFFPPPQFWLPNFIDIFPRWKDHRELTWHLSLNLLMYVEVWYLNAN